MKKNTGNVSEAKKSLEVIKNYKDVMPEILVKHEYYKLVIEKNIALRDAIEKEIKKTKDAIQKARFEIEVIDLDHKIYYRKMKYDDYVEHKAEFDTKFEELSLECSKNLKETEEKAKKLNMMEVQVAIDGFYENIDKAENKALLKVEYYLSLKMALSGRRK